MGVLDDPICRPIAERYVRWHDFMEQRVDFLLRDSALHTRAHCARVLLLALVIGNHYHAQDDELDVLAACAVFHDTRRQDDLLDVGHGKRAANYYQAFCSTGKLAFDERVAAIISWHDQPDADGIAAITRDQGKRCAQLYCVFKDADGLDRIRLGRSELDSSQLRTDYAPELVPFAERLLKLSKF